MADDKEQDGVWRTIRGRKVFIKDGQSLSDAMRESGKFDKSDIEEADKQKEKTSDKKKIKQLDWFESEYKRVTQIEKYTGLSRNQAALTYNAIVDYTGNGYTEIRNGKSVQKEKLIEEFIARHPKYDGKIYRGIALVDDSAIQEARNSIKTGEPINMRGISSWSGAENVAQDFAEGVAEEIGGTHKIIYETENVSGVGIDHLSKHHGEDEVIHSAKSRFVVESIQKVDNIYRIKVTEIKNE